MYRYVKSDIYYNKDGELDVDYYTQNHGGLSTRKGKDTKGTPYIASNDKLLNGHIVYSVYTFTTADQAAIFKEIKKGKLRSDLYDEWTEYTARYIWSEILYNNKPDLIVTPESSSTLTDDVAFQVSRMSNIPFISSVFKKNPVDKITIEIPEGVRVSDTTIKKVEQILDQIKHRGKFESKAIYKPYLKFFRNIYAGDEEYADRIRNKKIAIIDDSMTSRATLSNIFDVCDHTYQADESYGVTVFKKSGSRRK